MFASAKNYFMDGSQSQQQHQTLGGVLPQYHQRHASYQPQMQSHQYIGGPQTQQYRHQHSMSYSGGYDLAGYYPNVCAPPTSIHHAPMEFYPPPIRQQPHVIQEQHPQPQQQQQQPPTGGVSSVLDYEMDQMVRFVCWLCYGLMKRTDNPAASFHATVKSVLSATRLPKSTIVLALLYLSDKMENQEQPVMSDSRVFENLIISLVLANKFNDDNTFRNKSWSDATGLSVELINKLEREWLGEIKWRLHYEDGFTCIEECWKTWCDKFSTKPVVQTPVYRENYLSPASGRADSTSSLHQYHPAHSTTPREFRSPSSSLFSDRSQFSPVNTPLNSSPFYNEYQQPPPPPPEQLFENPFQMQYNSSFMAQQASANNDYFTLYQQMNSQPLMKPMAGAPLSSAQTQRYYALSHYQQQPMVPPMMSTGVCYGAPPALGTSDYLHQQQYQQQQQQQQHFYGTGSYCAATAC